MRRKHTGHSAVSRVDPRPIHNPLERPIDRMQARARNWVLTLITLMLPLSVWLATSTLAEQQGRVAEQSLTRHSVTAVTSTEAVTDVGAMQPEFSVQTAAPVDASWNYEGVDYDGQVTVSIGSPAGTEVDIWIDDSGERALPPLTEADAVLASIFTGLGSFLAVGCVLWGAYAALRFRLDAQRDVQWERTISRLLDEHSPN